MAPFPEPVHNIRTVLKRMSVYLSDYMSVTLIITLLKCPKSCCHPDSCLQQTVWPSGPT